MIGIFQRRAAVRPPLVHDLLHLRAVDHSPQVHARLRGKLRERPEAARR